MWPEPVERIASFLRASSAHGRIEELPPGIDTAPGTSVRAETYDCDGRTVVVLAPQDAEIDRERLRRRAGCADLRESPRRTFPFQGARVLLDRSLLAVRTLWLEAGTPRHVLGLSPGQLTRLTHAETGRFLVEE
jgi:prolyl-tRNA editing enzyme YbaK/EbsC (Cys-tRNA(Pro) deacylase)